MTDEKTFENPPDNPHNPSIPAASRTSAPNMSRRFGAVAFVEDISDAPDEADLTLESLRQAFAGLEDPQSIEPEDAPDEETGSGDFTNLSDLENPDILQGFPKGESDDEEPSTEGMTLAETDSVKLSPKNIVEAMLFVGDRENRPLPSDRAAEKMRNVSPEEIDRLIDSLNNDYCRLACPYTIRKEEDGYRMVLRSEFAPILEKFYGRIREARLSQQVIDTLAIVAYRQPITAEEVQKIRKQPSSAFLSQLVRRGLLEAIQEQQDRKKIVTYRTTERFLELFQLDTIDDLPMADEIDFR